MLQIFFGVVVAIMLIYMAIAVIALGIFLVPVIVAIGVLEWVLRNTSIALFGRSH